MQKAKKAAGAEGEGSVDSIQAAIQSAARVIGETMSDDDADLKGVRLRREQVVHVLFEGKSTVSDAAPDNAAGEESKAGGDAVDDGPEIASLSLVLGGKLIKGWLETKLPPWTDSPTPSDLREPPVIATPTPASLPNTTLAHPKSFSSSDFASASPSPSPGRATPIQGSSASGAGTPIELEASTTTAQAQQKYKDLDSFLDESDDEVELDQDAREDDEFRAKDDWDAADEDEDSDEDEEEDDEEEDEEDETSDEDEEDDE